MSLELDEEVFASEECSHIFKFDGPVKVKGEIFRDGKAVKLCFKGLAALVLNCDRCLEPVSLRVPFDFEEDISSEEEKESISDILVLDDIVVRSIIANLPMKVLCKEDCRGLCPACGKNLNEGSCKCDTSYINPKFESLRALFNVDEEV